MEDSVPLVNNKQQTLSISIKFIVDEESYRTDPYSRSKLTNK